MFLDFFIEPQALSENAGASFASREVIRRAIERFGCRAGSNDDWINIVRSLPQPEKNRWIETLKYVDVRVNGNSVSESHGPSGLSRGSDFDAFAILNDDQIKTWLGKDSLGESDLPAWLPTQRIEISNCERSVLSSVIQLREDWCSERIERGTSRDELWKTRLRPVVSCANTMVIVDRYFMKIGRKAKQRTSSSPIDGITWLFKQLGSEAIRADPMEVVIYCSYGNEPRLTDAELPELAGSFLESARGGISDLTIFIAPDNLFGQVEHDRYWRIWTGKRSLTLTFGGSVDMFDNERLARPSNFSYSIEKHISEESRKVEKQLEGLSNRFAFQFQEAN